MCTVHPLQRRLDPYSEQLYNYKHYVLYVCKLILQLEYIIIHVPMFIICTLRV